MANLKQLRSRISSVGSMQRISAAMKMVAAAKLRRAQQNAQAARPYAERMARMLQALAAGASGGSAPLLLTGTGRDRTHLLVIISSDRGLCGGFNANLARYVRRQVAELSEQGKEVKLLVIGRKGGLILRRDQSRRIVAVLEDLAKPAPDFAAAEQVRDRILAMLAAEEFDVCTVVYNKFLSALRQEVTPLQLIPLNLPQASAGTTGAGAGAVGDAVYEYEPSEEVILDALLPRNLTVQVFRAMLESFASEQGARMTAMDSASRNAGEMIGRLSVQYNRMRQAQITKELIEIVSGAEAL